MFACAFVYVCDGSGLGLVCEMVVFTFSGVCACVHVLVIRTPWFFSSLLFLYSLFFVYLFLIFSQCALQQFTDAAPASVAYYSCMDCLYATPSRLISCAIPKSLSD